jgi:hypothetical protein
MNCAVIISVNGMLTSAIIVRYIGTNFTHEQNRHFPAHGNDLAG